MATTVTLKIKFQDTVHRVLLQSQQVNYDAVAETIQEICPGEVVAKYRDDEGDLRVLCAATFSNFLSPSGTEGGNTILVLELFPAVLASDGAQLAGRAELETANAMATAFHALQRLEGNFKGKGNDKGKRKGEWKGIYKGKGKGKGKCKGKALHGPLGGFQGKCKGKGKSKGETTFSFKGKGKCNSKSSREGSGGSDVGADGHDSGNDLSERQVAVGFEELFQSLTLEPAPADAQPAEAELTELEVASPMATAPRALQRPEGSFKGKNRDKHKGEWKGISKGNGKGKCKGKSLHGPKGTFEGKGKSKGETKASFKGEVKCKGKSCGKGNGGSDAGADGSDLRERQVAIGLEELFRNPTQEFSKGKGKGKRKGKREVEGKGGCEKRTRSGLGGRSLGPMCIKWPTQDTMSIADTQDTMSAVEEPTAADAATAAADGGAGSARCDVPFPVAVGDGRRVTPERNLDSDPQQVVEAFTGGHAAV
jgi:hypothetical protein